QASRMAAFLGGKYDFGPEFMGVINRPDWSQLKGALERQRPGLKTMDFASNVRIGINMRCDRPPFNDVRVRRAVSLALDRRDLVEGLARAAGGGRPPRPPPGAPRGGAPPRPPPPRPRIPD